MNPGVVFYLVLSTVLWFGLVGRAHLPDVLLGFVVIFGGWRFLRHVAGENYTVLPSRFASSVRKISNLALFVVAPSVVRGTWHVLRASLSFGRHRFNPGVLSVRLPGASTEALFLMAFSITLTPDMQVMDIDDKSKTLYVHVLDTARIAEAEDEIEKMYKRYAREALP